MGSNSSKTKSNPSSLVNAFKYFLNGSRSSNGVVRTFPKNGSINKRRAEIQTSFPSSLNGKNVISNENTTSSRETTNFNTSQAKNENDTIDVSLQKRLQNLGPVQRQDVLTNNNSFIIPSLSRNESILQASKLQSSVTSQVVLNPTVSKPNNKIAESPLSSSTSWQQQLSATSTISLDSASNFTSQILPPTLKTNNSAVALLIARNTFSKEAEAEFANIGKSERKRRRYLDLDTVTKILILRDTKGGLGSEEIERRLELGDGVVKLLGKKGVVGIVE